MNRSSPFWTVLIIGAVAAVCVSLFVSHRGNARQLPDEHGVSEPARVARIHLNDSLRSMHFDPQKNLRLYEVPDLVAIGLKSRAITSDEAETLLAIKQHLQVIPLDGAPQLINYFDETPQESEALHRDSLLEQLATKK